MIVDNIGLTQIPQFKATCRVGKTLPTLLFPAPCSLLPAPCSLLPSP
ncbi:hypothetical protein [Moorena sp. SIO3H5]|nr:hypothetical protein [Moorena sp. SIO3H5]NEO71331.1 hypothetical protein [Moorena sp. SIO3H5]